MIVPDALSDSDCPTVPISTFEFLGSSSNQRPTGSISASDLEPGSSTDYDCYVKKDVAWWQDVLSATPSVFHCGEGAGHAANEGSDCHTYGLLDYPDGNWDTSHDATFANTYAGFQEFCKSWSANSGVFNGGPGPCGTPATPDNLPCYPNCPHSTYPATPFTTKANLASALANHCNSADPNIDAWDVSRVTEMDSLIYNLACTATFNSNIDAWDVSKVTTMEALFSDATAYDQPLNDWDVSKVTTMKNMIRNNPAYNQLMNGWDVSKVSSMYGMFRGNTAFDRTLNGWDVSKVSNMYSMFQTAPAFNRKINDWDVSKVTRGRYMFRAATAFAVTVEDWDVSSFTNMKGMFQLSSSFNQMVNGWDVSQVTTLKDMFKSATDFNQPLNSWDVSKVNDLGNQQFLDYIQCGQC
jgi:surface protein